MISDNEGLVRKICRLYAGSRDERNDLFQEIVLQLWRSFGTFRNESAMTTWIYRVALNTAINYTRRERRHRSADVEIPDMPDGDSGELKEKIAMLYRVITGLGRLDRALIFLHLEGYKYDEIAAFSGLTEANTATRISRLKKAIGEKMQKIYSQ